MNRTKGTKAQGSGMKQWREVGKEGCVYRRWKGEGECGELGEDVGVYESDGGLGRERKERGKTREWGERWAIREGDGWVRVRVGWVDK